MPLTSKLTRTAAAALLATSAGCIEIDKEKFEATQGAIFRWGGRSHPNPRVGLAGELLGDAADASYQHDQDSRIARETGEAIGQALNQNNSQNQNREITPTCITYADTFFTASGYKGDLNGDKGLDFHEFKNVGNTFSSSEEIFLVGHIYQKKGAEITLELYDNNHLLSSVNHKIPSNSTCHRGSWILSPGSYEAKWKIGNKVIGERHFTVK
jgi:hypothetical protein